ncbi:hypothetical protein [Albimonas pacifica]|uniref:Uncharacterized protein n=1 Tax=Albimonas pacifica TaxID=1114924 RepID=A0A1I3GKT1_9RHOB|nr:hypothetical protein [Albimonas pacifica]SFI24059.1 hypothetical protein SAMN05216258_105217 [Albimonas pacifica]
MNRDDHAPDPLGDLQTAHRTFLRLHGLLLRRIDQFALAMEEAGISEEVEDGARAKKMAEEITRLQSAIATLCRCEDKLVADIEKRGRRGDGDVDLDAARREILGELARLSGRD